MAYAEKLLDPKWQRKRLEVLQRDNFTCILCGDTEVTLHVHHKSYAKSGNPWDTANDQLATICQHCHSVVEDFKKITPGMPIPQSVIKHKEVNEADFYMSLYFRLKTRAIVVLYFKTSDGRVEFLSVLEEGWVIQMNEKLAEVRSKK